MGTRGIQDPLAANLLDEILAEQASLRQELMDLKQASPVFIERANPVDLKAPQEGQLIINPEGTHVAAVNEPVQYFENGEWRSIAVPAASVHHMPMITVTSPSCDLPQSTVFAGNWTAKDITWPGSGLTTIFHWHDYATVGSRVFGDNTGALPGLSPITIRKKGLYLQIATFVWDVTWGKLTQTSVYGASLNQVLASITGNLTDGTFIGDETESSDDEIHVRCLNLTRNISDTVRSPIVSARHLAAPRTLNVFLSIVRLSSNPNDTSATGNLFTIPG